ncbi:MAG: cysteine desulfurase family protein [Candidatus Nanopelagicales bacterium]
MSRTSPATYLDHAATTPLLPEARAAWLEHSSYVGNASSLHASGRRARRVVEESREALAAALGVRSGDVVLTAGGTESDNLALKGLAAARRAESPHRRRVLVSAVEHHAVLDPAEWLGTQGFDVTLLPVDRTGRVDPAAARDLMSADPDAVAVCSVMWANNEVGTVQPVDELAALCRDAGVPFHSDAVQAVGHLPVDAGRVDALTLSAHKLGGPTGVGALVLDRALTPVPLLHGGGQERDIRSGTVDVAGAAAFAAAVTVSVGDREAEAARVRALRTRLVEGVLSLVPDAVLNGPDPVDDPTQDARQRLPGVAHLSFPGCEGDALLMLLDAAGVECSTGSACTAGIPQPSHVLLAMGVDEETARGSLRFSLGHTSTDEDVDALLDALPGAVQRARRAGLVRIRPTG